MSFAQALSAYVNLNLLVIVGFLSLFMTSKIARRLKAPLGAALELKLHYLTLAACFALAMIQPLLPGAEIYEPPAKIWAAPTLKSFARQDLAGPGYLRLSSSPAAAAIPTDRATIAWLGLAALALAFGAMRFGADVASLVRLRRESFLVRRIGRVHIFVHDRAPVPFSYRGLFSANVVLPTAMLGTGGDERTAVVHELQHHRQGDTAWVYALWILRWVCAPNPAVHLWSRWLNEIQEFACDETLIGRNKVESQDYARCLVEAAQTAIDLRWDPVSATGIRFLVGRKLLKRRIENMLSKTATKTGRAAGLALGLALITMMGATALASKDLVKDRRVTRAAAEEMAARARQANPDFPIAVNDLVLKQLNRFIGTPEGREFMRDALSRLETYRPEIETQLRDRSMPEELMAVPIVESGYRNLPQGAQPVQAAGLWQIIPSTARNFGLRVEAGRDERLDIPLSTDAALRLLKVNQLRFQNWNLSLIAYNAGDRRVQRGIDETGQRNPWELIRRGYEGDKDYLARVMAAILIMRNPESVL